MSTVGEELLEARRRLRREGDPQLSQAGRQTLRRLASSPTTMIAGEESRTVDGYRRERMAAWDGRYPAAG